MVKLSLQIFGTGLLGGVQTPGSRGFVIYNFKTNQWTTPTDTPIIGAAIGGTVAGVVLLVAIGFFAYRRNKSTKKRRDDSRISSIVAKENISDSNNMQSGNIVLPDIPSSREKPSASKRIHAPNHIGQSPHTVLPAETDKDLGYEMEITIPNVSDDNEGEASSSNMHRSRNPQDRGQITPSLPSFSRNPQLIQPQEIRPTS